MTKAVAVADLELGTVLARVDIAVPPERVFRALTTSELTKWWGSDELYRTTGFTIDLRVGGAWRSEGVGRDGSAFHVGGEIVKLDPPRELVQTWKPSWEQGPASTVSYRLDAIPAGTRVTVRHTGFVDPAACSSHAEGWERVTGWLAAHLAGERRWFFGKLVPPRPTFPQDMTADEGALMARHADYLKAKIASGEVLVAGPVADPSGAYGIVVASVRDEVAMRALADGDPVIRANAGFRYDILAMPSLLG